MHALLTPGVHAGEINLHCYLSYIYLWLKCKVGKRNVFS